MNDINVILLALGNYNGIRYKECTTWLKTIVSGLENISSYANIFNKG